MRCRGSRARPHLLHERPRFRRGLELELDQHPAGELFVCAQRRLPIAGPVEEAEQAAQRRLVAGVELQRAPGP